MRKTLWRISQEIIALHLFICKGPSEGRETNHVCFRRSGKRFGRWATELDRPLAGGSRKVRGGVDPARVAMHAPARTYGGRTGIHSGPAPCKTPRGAIWC